MLAILDYKAGNQTSVRRALDHLGIPCVITADPAVVDSAAGVIFPGVGAAGQAMRHLQDSGLDAVLRNVVSSGRPLLGICLGCQIMVAHSDENDTPTLGLVEGRCVRFDEHLEEGGAPIRIPHMGWNTISRKQESPILKDVPADAAFYFVHGYYVETAPEKVIATSCYGTEFCAVYGQDGLWAIQFHPEKSGRPGMLTKRVIPCLDVRNGRLTKGVKFVGNEDIGDPVETARQYYEAGADEIVFYDITASAEARGIFLDVVEKVASEIFIPFSVGGGISTVQDMRAVLLAGAEKISVNSAAVKHPEIISQGADAFGSQAIVVGMDVKRVPVTPEIPSGYEIVIHGGRKAMGIDAIEWAKRCEALGAGELCVNSIDADGTKDGYELTLTRLICDAVRIPVIASGGAGSPQHMVDAVTEGRASAALIASIVHYGEYTIGQLKQYMADRGVPVRLTW